uniref:non-specific serine/threonine protein kinase n=1 Tax=Meloidogyne incognita TaxID=6306 RepID=A0A914MH52_MELIC
MNPQNRQQNNYLYTQQQLSSSYSYTTLVPPTSINDFYDVVRIGSGSFAQVYRGYELINQRPVSYREVALKKINLAAITDPATYKTTINEVRLFTNFNHQNIVKCFRSFEEISPLSQNKYLVLVLEYVNGGDLEILIRVIKRVKLRFV